MIADKLNNIIKGMPTIPAMPAIPEIPSVDDIKQSVKTNIQDLNTNVEQGVDYINTGVKQTYDKILDTSYFQWPWSNPTEKLVNIGKMPADYYKSYKQIIE